MRRRKQIDPMIAMINVVFLLIAFFLVGRFQPPAPVAVDLPTAMGEAETQDAEIWIDVEGTLYFERHQNEAAIAAIAVANLQSPVLAIDENAEANSVATWLSKLSKAGVTGVAIEVTP